LPAKILAKFSKEYEKIRIIGGGITEKSLSVEEINTIASLPSLDEIKAKLIGLLNLPAGKLLRTIIEPPTRVSRIISTKNS